MSAAIDPPTGGKDLHDLTDLSRRPMVAFLQKQGMPTAPREEPATPFQKLSVLLPNNLWRWLHDYIRWRLGPTHKFLAYDHPERDNGVYPLGGDDGEPIRVALAGDWGTGTDEAHRVATLIERFDPHYAIHLGDVYFVGDANEVRENFLGAANPRHDFTPCRWPHGSRGSFALNGNHEMYARGYGYFDLMLPALGLNGPNGPRGQTASFFCLQNEHWRVIALDTGYNSIGLPIIENFLKPECALPETLLSWLRAAVFAQDDKRGIVLLSHHQYYSRFDNWYTKQAEQMAEFIRRPVLWFWGHEHRLAVYKKFKTGAGIPAYGRCIGHGGMPVDLPPETATHEECEVEFVDARKYVNDENLDVGVNGFVTLDFAGPTLRVDYIDVFGEIIFTEAWIVADGEIDRVAAGQR